MGMFAAGIFAGIVVCMVTMLVRCVLWYEKKHPEDDYWREAACTTGCGGCRRQRRRIRMVVIIASAVGVLFFQTVTYACLVVGSQMDDEMTNLYQRKMEEDHYGQEAESYTFYRVPKILFTATIFDHLSTDAKLLYGILLDRMQLSIRNRWIDDDGRVYIYYPQQNIMDALTCGNKKAGQLLAELDDKNGIGLITRAHQGLGKPDKIYVHKCIIPLMTEPPPSKSGDQSVNEGGWDVETTLQDMSKGHVQRCPNDMSGDVQTTRQDMSKRPCNDTEGNNTEKSDTEINETDLILSDLEAAPSYADGRAIVEEGSDGKDAIEEYYAYRGYFEQECCLEDIRRENPYHTDMVDEILEILTDTCCNSRPVIRIGGEDKPAQIVKSKLMKLNGEHIRYVLMCFLENTTKVRNIKQYLLAALYNAPMTIGSYYTALVRHDMYGTD